MQVWTRNSYEPPSTQPPDVAVYFDVFRASTTIAALLSRRPERIVSTNDEAEAASLVRSGHLLVSEVFRGGLDNSPTQVLATDFAGRRVVHKSTNLTTAFLPELGRAGRVLIGGFVNASALVRYLVQSGARSVELVAAAHVVHRTEAVEDTCCVRMLARMLGGERFDVIPGLEAVTARLAAKRVERPEIRPHYWTDTAMALTLDALPWVAEALRLDARTAEILAVSGG